LAAVWGVDIPGEGAGFLPTPEWKEKNLNEQWYIGDTYHVSIGQGNLLVTPLQIAAGTAAIANEAYYIVRILFLTRPRTNIF